MKEVLKMGIDMDKEHINSQMILSNHLFFFYIFFSFVGEYKFDKADGLGYLVNEIGE